MTSTVAGLLGTYGEEQRTRLDGFAQSRAGPGEEPAVPMPSACSPVQCTSASARTNAPSRVL